MKPIEERSKNV